MSRTNLVNLDDAFLVFYDSEDVNKRDLAQSVIATAAMKYRPPMPDTKELLKYDGKPMEIRLPHYASSVNITEQVKTIPSDLPPHHPIPWGDPSRKSTNGDCMEEWPTQTFQNVV